MHIVRHSFASKDSGNKPGDIGIFKEQLSRALPLQMESQPKVTCFGLRRNPRGSGKEVPAWSKNGSAEKPAREVRNNKGFSEAVHVYPINNNKIVWLRNVSSGTSL